MVVFSLKPAVVAFLCTIAQRNRTNSVMEGLKVQTENNRKVDWFQSVTPGTMHFSQKAKMREELSGSSVKGRKDLRSGLR